MKKKIIWARACWRVLSYETVLLRLKSVQLKTNQIWEFCYSYDKRQWSFLVMISDIIKKASKRLYFLVQLKEIKSSPAGYDHFFTACMYDLFLRIRRNVASEL